MKVNKLAIFLMLTIASLIIVGCSNDGDNHDNGKVTLELWNNNDAGKTYYPKLIEKFESEHPEIEVDLKNLSPDTVDAEMQSAISDDNLPDLFNQESFMIDELVDLDLIHELDDIFPEEEREEYAEGIFNDGNASLNGHVYMFPKYKGGTYMMYYNKEVMEEYNISEVPETWEEIKKVGKQIYKDSEGSTYGLLIGTQSDWLLNDVTKIMATELAPESTMDYENGVYNYANNGHAETLNFFKDLLDDDILSPTSLEVINEEALEYFAVGESAFLIDGNWTGQLLSETDFEEFGVTKLPTKNTDGQHYDPLEIDSNDGLYVAKSTEHLEEAKIFLEFLQDNLYEEMLKLGTAVTAKDPENYDIEFPFDQLQDISDIFNETATTVPNAVVRNPEASEVETELKKNVPDTTVASLFEDNLGGQIDDLEEELQKFDEEYNEAFTEAIENNENVDREDFKFSNWVPYEPYTDEDYDELE